MLASYPVKVEAVVSQNDGSLSAFFDILELDEDEDFSRMSTDPVFLGSRKSLCLDFPGRIHGQDSFFGQPGKQHPDGRHVLLDRGWRGLALKCFDICGDRDRLDVFEVLISSALDPGQELLDRPVIGGARVSVADRDRKKLEKLFASRWPGARNDGGSCERIYRNNGKFGVRHG